MTTMHRPGPAIARAGSSGYDKRHVRLPAVTLALGRMLERDRVARIDVECLLAPLQRSACGAREIHGSSPWALVDS